MATNKPVIKPYTYTITIVEDPERDDTSLGTITPAPDKEDKHLLFECHQTFYTCAQLEAIVQLMKHIESKQQEVKDQ